MDEAHTLSEAQQLPFSVTITYKDGVTQEEQEATLAFIKATSEEANTQGVIPDCINEVSIKRL